MDLRNMISLDYFLETSFSKRPKLKKQLNKPLNYGYETSSDSSNDEEYLRKVHKRTKNFVEIIETFDNKQFKTHFRLSKSTVELVLTEIGRHDVIPAYTAGRQNISAKKSLLMTIWYLANMETFRQLADRFDVARSTAFACVKRIISFLNNKAAEYIKWSNEIASTRICANFKNKQGIDNVIGAIDCTHLSIKRPADQAAFCNRKGYTSIILQAICDDEKLFTDIFCGETGSIHDARVLKKSNLYRYACENGLPGNRCLVGDSAYPNLQWLIVSFKDNGHLSDEQKQFNYKLSSTRMVIEHAFGLLKGRFRRLKHFDNSNINFTVQATIAACVLHNLCISCDDLADIYDISDDDEIPVCPRHHIIAGDRRTTIMNSLVQ